MEWLCWIVQTESGHTEDNGRFCVTGWLLGGTVLVWIKSLKKLQGTKEKICKWSNNNITYAYEKLIIPFVLVNP